MGVHQQGRWIHSKHRQAAVSVHSPAAQDPGALGHDVKEGGAGAAGAGARPAVARRVLVAAVAAQAAALGSDGDALALAGGADLWRRGQAGAGLNRLQGRWQQGQAAVCCRRRLMTTARGKVRLHQCRLRRNASSAGHDPRSLPSRPEAAQSAYPGQASAGVAAAGRAAGRAARRGHGWRVEGVGESKRVSERAYGDQEEHRRSDSGRRHWTCSQNRSTSPLFLLISSSCDRQPTRPSIPQVQQRRSRGAMMTPGAATTAASQAPLHQLELLNQLRSRVGERLRGAGQRQFSSRSTLPR